VAAPDADGYESRFMQLLGQRDELLAADDFASKVSGTTGTTSPCAWAQLGFVGVCIFRFVDRCYT
jgi:hypothetical protein